MSSYYSGGRQRDPIYSAAVCERGHVATALLELRDPEDVPKWCPTCGALVHKECLNCNQAIRGDNSGVIGAHWEPDSFCRNCGHPFPWASREAIVYHLENQLKEQPDLSQGDRRALLEQLQALRESPASADVTRRQVRALEALKKAAPAAWQVMLPVAQALLTAEARRQLGLPPA